MYPKNRSFRIGDLVIISANNVSRSHLPMGCIIQVYPGRDSLVHSVKLKTSNGELSRPSQLLCLLCRLRHRCFPVNFAKFLRTPFLQNTSGRLLLQINQIYSSFERREFVTLKHNLFQHVHACLNLVIKQCLCACFYLFIFLDLAIKMH